MDINVPSEDDEPEIWKTSPAESSNPSFPFVERDVPPAVSEEYVIPAPPPPPPSILERATGQSEWPTTPLASATFAGVGVIAGAFITLAMLLGILWITGVLPLHPKLSSQADKITATAQSTSSTIGNPTPGSPGSATPNGGGQSHPPAPGKTATAGSTPVATGTTTPGATATPSSQVPLTVTATARDHMNATMTINTQLGATLIITVTYCDGSTDSKYNNYQTVPQTLPYIDTLTLVKCSGQGTYGGTVAVTAHLNGYQDAAASAQIILGG